MIFAFGEFEVDVRLCVLRRGAEAIPVQPKVFDTLRYLIEHRDRVVSKAELLEAVWDGQRLSGVAVPWSIRHARRVLGQAGDEKRPIETVRGRGYRFAAEVDARLPTTGSVPGEASVRPRSRTSGEPFLGRESVMQRLAGALSEAQGVSGSLWLLVGDAGIGKTRCAAEAATAARQANVAVCVGRCTTTEGAPAFWPWIQILREVYEDRKLTTEARSGVRDALDRLAPRALPAGQSPAPAVVDASRFWLSEAVARALKLAARGKPRVLILEDLHAADDASIEVLCLLAPDLAQSRILTIATSRDDVGGRFSRRLRPCEVILLSGLTVGEVERYLSDTIGDGVQPDLAPFVHARTGGNPLLLKEAVRMVIAQNERDGGVRRAASVSLPDVARGFLHDRIATLVPGTREVLEAASALGERFELSVLRRMVDQPTDALLASMDDALQSRIVERQVGEGYSFSHALLRDALYDELSTVRRLGLHLRAASVLSALSATEQPFRAIAYHLHSALPESGPEEVERYSRLAADEAMQVFAYSDAAELYRWAISAQGHRGASDLRATCELFMSAAYAERQAGHVPEARAYCKRAIDLATKMNFGDLLVRAARSLRPTVWLAPVPDRLVLDALERALDILSPEEDAARVQALGLLANIPPHSLSIDRSRELSARALEMARDVGDRALVLETLVRSFPALTGPDTTGDLLAAADEVLRLDGPPASWWSAEAFLARHHALVQRGDPAGAGRALEAFGDCARLLRISEAVWQYDRLCAQRNINAGEFDAAEARFGELLATSEGFRQYAAFHYAAQMNALSWARSDRPLPLSGAAVGASADVAWQWAASVPAYRAERVMMLVHAGETATASSELDEIARDGFSQVTRDMAYLYTLCRLGQAAIALGRQDVALTLYALLKPYSSFNAVNGMSLSIGSVAHYLGLIARFLGRTSEAVAYLGDAVAANVRLGDRVHGERARVVLSELTLEATLAP